MDTAQKHTRPNPAAAALRFVKALNDYQSATMRIANASAQMQETTKTILGVGLNLTQLQAPYKV